jgi:diguanylate cyclase (GGDEF)-like protein
MTTTTNAEVLTAGQTTSEATPERLLAELIQIGIALTTERDLGALLERIVSEARRFTGAEGGTLFLREANRLRFAVVQNDALARKVGEREARRRLTGEPLHLDQPSLAAHVARTGDIVNLTDADPMPAGTSARRCYGAGSRTSHRAGSVLAVPLRDSMGTVLGVLELVNARDARGDLVPFAHAFEDLVRALVSHAAAAIRNAQLEEMSFKDPLTDIYNRRYFELRLEEEVKRHVRFDHPLSLVLVDVDYFKTINDRFGHREGDVVLREAAQLLTNQSRSFTTVTRYGGDEFAILLVNTPKSGALTYASRMKGVIERYPFMHGPVTVSLGVATIPDDAETANALFTAADVALYDAKRLGRNTVASGASQR